MAYKIKNWGVDMTQLFIFFHEYFVRYIESRYKDTECPQNKPVNVGV